MAIRILSGIIVPREDHQTSGEVVLKFDPYELEHESYDIAQLVYVGERSNGDFKHAPWHVISLRKFSFWIMIIPSPVKHLMRIGKNFMCVQHA